MALASILSFFTPASNTPATPEPGSPAAWLVASPAARRTLSLAGWLLVAVVVCSRFFSLGQGELKSWDESLYAWRAKVAAAQGLWFDQSAHSYNYFYSGSFPPLHVWQMAAMFRLFGYEEWAARFPTAVLAALGVGALYVIGRLVAGHPAGVMAVAALGTTAYMQRYAKAAQFDMPYTVWMFLYLACALGAMRLPHRRRLLLMLAGGCMGAGLMTKIAVPAMAAVAVFLWQGLLLALAWRHGDARYLNPLEPTEFTPSPGKRPPLACAAWRYFCDHVMVTSIAFVIWAPWHLFMWAKHGQTFLDWYFGYHLLSRSRQVHDFHDGSWSFYLEAMWDRLPAFLFVLAVAGLITTAGRLVWRALHPPAPDTPAWSLRLEAIMLLGLVFFVFLGGILQMAATKREIYMMPIYMMLCLTSALHLFEWLMVPRRRWLAALATLVPLAMFLIISRSGDPRIEYVWEIMSGRYTPEAGLSVVDDVITPLQAGLAGTAGAVAGLAALSFGVAVFLRRRHGGSVATHTTAMLAAAMALVAVVFSVPGFHRLFLTDAYYENDTLVLLRPWIDDVETYPIAGFVARFWHDYPSYMYYSWGAVKSARPIAARPMQNVAQVRIGMFDVLRRPGALLVFEPGIGERPGENVILAEELRGFRRIELPFPSAYRLYEYTGDDAPAYWPARREALGAPWRALLGRLTAALTPLTPEAAP